MAPVIVTMRHIRQAKLCASGARAWFKSYGLDWSRFLAAGVQAEELEKTGDPLAMRVVAIARAQHDTAEH